MLSRPPSARVVSGLGSSTQAANVTLRGQEVRRVHVDGAIVRDPHQLARALIELSGIVRDTATTALANPFASSILIQNIASWPGTMLFNHYLGRPYVGWLMVRPRGGVPTLYETNPTPSTVNTSKQISLVCSAPGFLFDLLVY